MYSGFRILATAAALMGSVGAMAQDRRDEGWQTARAAAQDRPGWYQNAGEGAFSWRTPQLFALGGVHWNSPDAIAPTTNNCATASAPFSIGCPPPLPARTIAGLSMTSSWGFTAGIGARIAPAVRVSLEYNWQKTHDIHVFMAVNGVVNGDGRGSLSTQQLSANLALDIAGMLPPGALGRFNPYVTGGLGVAFNQTGQIVGFSPPGGMHVSTSGGARFTDLLWSVGGGIQYALNRNWVFDLGYSYMDAGRYGTSKTDNVLHLPFPSDCSVDCSATGRLRLHRIQAKLIYEF